MNFCEFLGVAGDVAVLMDDGMVGDDDAAADGVPECDDCVGVSMKKSSTLNGGVLECDECSGVACGDGYGGVKGC